MRFGANLLTILTLLLAGTCSLRAADIDYATQVKPILTARCTVCHGALKQRAGLRLDAASLALKGGKHGAVVVPGEASESKIVHSISGGLYGAPKMPEEGDPLKPEQIEIIKRWIDEGAQAPADEAVPAGPESHWSFKPPVRPDVPKVTDARWSKNPIDAFVAAEHERRGLKPQPEADKATLLRRVTLDLTGLPPTRDELRAFLADTSPDAYERLVDRLLASPRYGERWGRHWMDVWRYSDWYGYGAEVRFSQPHIWRWRDWIIESLNADKPYDQMVREMLAGDEIAPTDPQTVRATGFLARSWSLYNRNGWMEEVVEHTGKAFLGMTFNCAKCHDHMFDPVSQKEYYGLRAIFEPYGVRLDPAPGSNTLDTKADGVARVFDANEKAQTFLFLRGDDRNPKKDEPLSPTVPAALGGKFEVAKVDLPPAAYYAGLRDHVRTAMIAGADAAIMAEEKALPQNEAAVTAAQSAYAALATPPAATTQAVVTQAFLADTFAAARPDVWQFDASGPWKYADGKLVQTEAGPTLRHLRSLANHPPDFTARLTFKITGGQVYQSVGIGFDATDAGDGQIVYLSAHAPGPLAATFYLQANQPVYTGNAKATLPVKAKEQYELRVDVRDTLANVYVNDRLVLAHKLPKARQAGRFAVVTYDATAEFTNVRVEPLPAGAKLAEKVDGPAVTAIPPFDPAKRLVDAANALWMAHETVAIGKLKVSLARAERAALDPKIAADKAKYATPPAPDAEPLALAAGRAERYAAVCKAELETRRAQHTLSLAQQAAKKSEGKAFKTLTDAGLKLVAQGAALEAARALLDKPSSHYTPLTPLQPATSTGRRTALAKWVTSRDNPLAARVAVNHIWMRHFGAPIVPTVFDFGLNGKPPTNPALLDWLAVELMDRNWSAKSMHRLMVTSAAYRMRSDAAGADEAARKRDPDNVYLWRANVGRMQAEVVRDSILAVAGQLDLTTGGPDLDHQQGLVSRRRSLYFRHAHEKQMTFLKVFDAASVNECYRRDESVMPQQALALANSPLALAESRRVASILTNQVGGSEDARAAFIAAAFEHLLCRAPSADERSTCERFLAEQASCFTAAKDLTPFAAGDANAVAPSSDPNQRARENLIHVLMNHNDFVTIR